MTMTFPYDRDVFSPDERTDAEAEYADESDTHREVPCDGCNGAGCSECGGEGVLYVIREPVDIYFRGVPAGVR
jgi:hypothetical protein